MKKRIVIHTTNTPADMSVTLNDIEDMNGKDMKSDPMSYHYIVNIVLSGLKVGSINYDLII